MFGRISRNELLLALKLLFQVLHLLLDLASSVLHVLLNEFYFILFKLLLHIFFVLPSIEILLMLIAFLDIVPLQIWAVGTFRRFLFRQGSSNKHL